MADEVTPGAAPAVADAQPAPTPAPAPTAVGGVQPGAKPEGSLPDDVHPAVKAERERATRYRQTLEQVVVLDDNGQVLGLRPEVVEQVKEHLARQPAQPTADPEAAYNARIREWAAKTGFLPEQVEGVVTLAQGIARSMIEEATGPMVDSSIETITANLVAMDAVPKEAVPFVTKWVNRARKMNPRALLTSQGRETVLRQALGEFTLAKAKAALVPAGGGAPAQLRPTPGGTPGAPSPDEQLVRQKLGLPGTWTDQTPREVV